MNACKHSHVDGARHIPCPKCQIEAMSLNADHERLLAEASIENMEGALRAIESLANELYAMRGEDAETTRICTLILQLTKKR